MEKSAKTKPQKQKSRIAVWLGRISLGLIAILVLVLLLASTVFAPAQQQIRFGAGQKAAMDLAIRQHYHHLAGRISAFANTPVPYTKAELLALPPEAEVVMHRSLADGRDSTVWVSKTLGQAVGQSETARLARKIFFRRYRKLLWGIGTSLIIWLLSLIWPKKKINENEKYQ